MANPNSVDYRIPIGLLVIFIIKTRNWDDIKEWYIGYVFLELFHKAKEKAKIDQERPPSSDIFEKIGKFAEYLQGLNDIKYLEVTNFRPLIEEAYAESQMESLGVEIEFVIHTIMLPLMNKENPDLSKKSASDLLEEEKIKVNFFFYTLAKTYA